MACIRKRRNRWTLDYRDQHGRRRLEVVHPNTRKAAEQMLVQRLAEIGRGEYRPPREEKTFAELASAYESGHIATNIRESTAKDYRTNIRLHLAPYFGRTKLCAITPDAIERWRTWMRNREVRSRTINKSHTLLSAMLRFAIRYRWASDNAAAALPKLRIAPTQNPDAPEEGNMLRPEEVRSLLEHADERWRLAIKFAVSTGLRQGEQLGLQWGDIDWKSKQVHVRRQFSKGRFADVKTRQSRRRVGLSDELLSDLTRWRLACPKGEHELVFPADDGGPLNHGILLRSGFYPALRRAKLRHVRWHDLRHTFASLLIAADVHPKRIQALMGHSTIRITLDVYGHLMRDLDDGAAEKLSDLLGSKTVASGAAPSQEQSISACRKMEAGVGIEPAYTDLQSAA
jgi:integrase